MLSIRVNDIYLDLDETQIRFEIINSIFEQAALQGDWSFPGKIKWTDKNAKALGFANMLEVPRKKISYRAFVYFETKSFIVGTFILNGGGNNYFNFNISGGVKGLINAEKKLKDLTYEAPGTSDGSIVLADLTTAALDFQTADYNNIIAFPPHSNPNFYGNANPDFQGIVNIVIAEDGTHPQNTADPGGNKYCLVPFVYLFYVLKTIFKECGLTPSGSFWADVEMSKALLYNNYALDNPDDLQLLVLLPANQILNFDTTPDVYINAFLDNTIAGTYDPWNYWNNYDHFYTLPVNTHYVVQFTCKIWGYDSYANVPSSGTVKISIASLYGSTYTIIASRIVSVAPGVTVDVNFSVDIPDSTGADTIFIWCSNGDTSGDCKVTMLADAKMIINYHVFNYMNKTIKIKNHVPDITIEELLNELKKAFQLDLVYDFINNKANMDYIDTVLDGAPELDLTSKLGKEYELLFDDKNKGYVVGYDFGTSDNLAQNNFKPYDASKLIGIYTSVDNLPAPVLGDLAIVKSTNKIMQAQPVGTNLAWVDFSDNYYDIITGNGETEVKSRLAPMMMLEAKNETLITPDPANTRALIPAISETGSSPMFDLGENAASLRIVFMRGLNSPGGMYVMASSTNYDQLGASTGNYTMKMNDADGLYLKFHEKIITALTNGDIVQRDLQADINLLGNRKLKRKISADNMHWLLKSISVSIGRTIQTSKSYWLKL